jgi:hypothetical protein
MPYRTFNSWLFDGSRNSPIPPASGKIDILKYNSPITTTFILQMFLRNGPLNDYLDTYFNNVGLRYLEKEDFFMFIKKCVIDFRVRRNDVVFYPRKARNKLYDALREKMPYFKNNDLELLGDMIEKSDEKESVYQTLGIEVPVKKKIKTGKKIVKGKVSLQKLMNEHFSIIKI